VVKSQQATFDRQFELLRVRSMRPNLEAEIEQLRASANEAIYAKEQAEALCAEQ
jgi:hypothetical protein